MFSKDKIQRADSCGFARNRISRAVGRQVVALAGGFLIALSTAPVAQAAAPADWSSIPVTKMTLFFSGSVRSRVVAE